METTMDQLREEIKLNPDIIDTLMDGKFNWQTLIQGADKIGLSVDESDINTYFEERCLDEESDSFATYFTPEDDSNEMRELHRDEMEFVSGGGVVVIVTVAAIVAVGAIVVVGGIGGGLVVSGVAAIMAGLAIVAATTVTAGGGGTGGGGGDDDTLPEVPTTDE